MRAGESLANDVRVRLIGDASSLERALQKAGLSADAAGSSFSRMGKYVVGGLAAFAGVETGARLLAGTVKAAENAETANRLLAVQLKNVGLSFRANDPEIKRFTESLSKMSGFTNTELTTGFTNLVRVTKSVGKAQKDLALAVDLARLKHIDLATATSLVTKAEIGMVGGLRRMGINVTTVTTAVDELRAAHTAAAAAAAAHGEKIAGITKEQLDAAKATDKLSTSTRALAQLHQASAGAAEAYGQTAAGAMDRFQAAIEHLQVAVGKDLLPKLTTLTNAAVNFIDNWDKAGTSANNFHTDLTNLVDPMKTIAQLMNQIAQSAGGWGKVFHFAAQALKDGTEQLQLAFAIDKKIVDLFKSGKAQQTGSGGAAVAAVTGGGGQTGTRTAHGKDQGAAIAATARTQLGIAYQWGGPAILGAHTDCSGLAQAVLAKNGIHVGRTTYEQWSQGKAVVQPQPGDLVFFEMGKKGPQHVGIYIGNDQFIEDPHTGSSVRVSQLSTRNDYVGARTYITAASGGGKAPSGKTGGTTPTFATTAKKAGSVSFALPQSIRTNISLAALTKTSADDILALNQAKKYIESKLGSMKGELKIQALDALKGINDQIQGIEDSAHAKAKAAAAAHAAALKKILNVPLVIRTAIAAASLTPKTSDDLKALNQAKKYLESKLGAVSGQNKVDLLNEIKSIDDQIQAIDDAAHAKALTKQKAALAKQQAALKAHMAKLKAIVTANQQAFENAFQALAERAFAAFDRATQAGLANVDIPFQLMTDAEKALQQFQQARDSETAAALDQQQGMDLANAIAGGDPAQIKAAQDAIYQTSLDKQEVALQRAADQSRAAQDAAQQTAEQAYQDARDLQKTQLQAWLDEQQIKLEQGTTNWTTFFNDLINQSGIAGTNTATAFWQAFADAGGIAQGSLSALSAAQATVNPPKAQSGMTIHTGSAYGGDINMPHLASGGLITRTGVALVHKGETVVPAKVGAGVVNNYYSFPNYVGSKQELIAILRNENALFKSRNARSAF